MKVNLSLNNILIISVVFLLTGSLAWGQIQLTENWDSGNSIPTSSSSAPSTPTDYATSSGIWTLFKSYRHGTSNYSAPYALRLLKNATAAYAITPSLNSIGTISFWGYGSSSKPIFIYKSTDGGSNWTFLDSVFTGNGAFAYCSLTVNTTELNVKIKFENGTVSVNDLNIDNVVITSYSTDANITVSTTSLTDFGNVVAGNTSSSLSYTVSGTNLTGNIIITSPTGFEVSTDDFIYSGSINLIPSSGTVPNTTIYTRFAPGSAIGSMSGNIAHTSSGATPRNVAVNGIALAPEPTVQSTISFGAVTGNSIVVNFPGGNGSNRIVVVRSSSVVNWVPTDANAVSGVNSNFSLATDQGSGNRVVFDGSDSSLLVTGLTQNTTYYFAVYEYNMGTNNSQNYSTTSPGTGNQTTLAVPTIVVTPSSLSYGNVVINTISTEKTYSLSGTTLTPSSGNITVTVPTGFEISTTSGSGFSTSIQIPYTDGVLTTTTIYVRFRPTAIQSYIGNITNVGGGATTQNVALSGNGIAPAAPNEFQAEDAILVSSYIMTQYPGYTGTGYVDMADKTGSSVEFVFSRSSAQTDTVTIYFANGGSSRTLTISLNDATVGTLNFPNTGSWSTWSSAKTTVALLAGINRLRFTLTTNGSGPNLDRIVVGGQSATAMYRLTLVKSGAGNVSANPAETYYESGTAVTLTATPAGGNVFFRWGGTDESTSNPFILVMNSHKTIIGVMTPAAGFGSFPYESAPKAFASVGAFGYSNGTTGGTGPNSSTVYVTNSDSLSKIMLRRVDANRTLNFPPLTVYVIGTLIPGSVFGNMLDVKDVYDISIIGVGTDAGITGFGLNIVRSKNIIVRNLKIANSPVDGITIQADDAEGTGNHIWIDHCTVTNCYDGAIDISHTASYVTLSWNHIYNHDKACLLGHSDGQTSDAAMKITYHHNYFDSTTQRNPRVRFAKTHVYNNYYRKNYIYGVSSNLEADVVVEGSYFLNVPIPTETSRDGSPPGDLIERNNIFVNCGVPGTRGTAFEPSTFYSYSLDPAADIPQMLTSYAGSGKFDFLPNNSQYLLTINATNGSVIKNPDQVYYNPGSTVQLTAVPATGYHFVNWSGDAGGSANPTTITMDSDKNITANFAINQYTITSSAGSNGSISPSGVLNVNYGDSLRFTMTPHSGFRIDSVIVDDMYVGALSNYTFRNISADHTIRATFSQIPVQFILSINAVNGNVIRDPEQASYDTGSTVQLTAIPDTGYHFVNWTGDLSGSLNPDIILMNSNKTVTANFSINQYTITASAGENGTINPAGVINVNYGDSLEFTITPATSYRIDSVIVDDVYQGTMSSYKFKHISSNHSIRAKFVIDTYTLSFMTNSGWNMISVPLTVADYRKSVLFPNSTSNAFMYSGGYIVKDTLQNGLGYWLKFASAEEVQITGNQRFLDSVDVFSGWNIIGSISVPMITVNITPSSGTSINSFFYGYEGGYVQADTIKPGKAYWVKVLNNGKLYFNSGTLSKEFLSDVNWLNEFNKLIITDALGNSQVLYFGADINGIIPVDYYELPPTPPEGIFDVRYNSQRIVEIHPSAIEKSKIFPILISSAVFPVTVNWDIINGNSADYELSEGKNTIKLTGNGSIKLANENIKSISLKAGIKELLPEEFSLDQNYPNPFNPSTTVRIGLPVRSNVTLRVYDLLGQQVSEIVTGTFDAGYHSFTWTGISDAGTLVGSGIYFYKYEASRLDDGQRFTEIRKMILMK